MIREALFFLTMICVAVGVSGCGTFSKTADKAKTISKAKCESVNVYDFGYQTARAGLRSDQSKFNDYVKSCGKYGVTLNKTKYKEGREAGNKTRCESVNVYDLGYQTARAGLRSDQSKFNDYVKSCDKHGVALNKTKYKKGREAGLKGLCVYQEGYKMGLIGKKYDFVCPENTAKDFLQGYSSGLKLHTSQKKPTTTQENKSAIGSTVSANTV